MATKKLPPMHPGEVLREGLLEPLRLTPYELAQALDIPRTRIERIAREETAVTADTAHRLAAISAPPPQFRLNLLGRSVQGGDAPKTSHCARKTTSKMLKDHCVGMHVEPNAPPYIGK